MSLRISTYILLFTLFVSSCSSSSSEAYPTYDPFAPIGAPGGVPQSQNGVPLPPGVPHSGPTPTRAPLSVPLPLGGAGFIPTPDAPHLVPAARENADQYTVQSGDTLFTISQQYGVTVDALMQANGLNDPNNISEGVVLTVPPATNDPNSGSSFKIIPDSELVYGPASINFDVDSYLKSKGGYLADYSEEVGGEYLSGAQIIMRIAQNYSINPRLLVALIEYRSGWVTNPTPSNVDYPLGYYNDYYAGLNRQLGWAADNLNRGYYLWRANAIASVPLADGSNVPLDPTINAGTVGAQYFLALNNDRANWDLDVSQAGLFQTYSQLFGSPFGYDIASFRPLNLTQPPMQLPFEPGVTWSFTGGPHGGWDTGSAWGALDFAPPIVGLGCGASDLWDVAVADGFIVRSDDGAVIQDLDNDGYEQTGWTVLYMHVDSNERIPAGTYAYAGDHIGHPSCEGGISNATHLHLARRYNGEWISADGNLPFNLDGWISSGNGNYYDGFLTRGGVQLQAEEGVKEGVNLISR